MFFDNVKDVNIQDLITFRYNGGSNPGSVRRVIVERIDDKDYLEGYDVDNDGYRRYKIEKMESICKLCSGIQDISVSQLRPHQMITFMHHLVRYANGVTVVTNELHRGYIISANFSKDDISFYDLDRKQYMQITKNEMQSIIYHGMVYDPIKLPKIHRLKKHIQEQFKQCIDDSIIAEILKFQE